MASSESLLNESMKETQSPQVAQVTQSPQRKWVDIVNIGGPMTVVKPDYREIEKILKPINGNQDMFVIFITGESGWKKRPFFMDSLISFLELKKMKLGCKWIESGETMESTGYDILDKPGTIQMFETPFHIKRTDGKSVWVLVIDAQNLQQIPKSGDLFTDSITNTIASCGFVVSTVNMYIALDHGGSGHVPQMVEACVEGMKQNSALPDSSRINNFVMITQVDEIEDDVVDKDGIEYWGGDVGELKRKFKKENFTYVQLPSCKEQLPVNSSPADIKAKDGEPKNFVDAISKLYDHLYDLLDSEETFKTCEEFRHSFEGLKSLITPKDKEVDQMVEDGKKLLELMERINGWFNSTFKVICCYRRLKRQVESDIKVAKDECATERMRAVLQSHFDTRAMEAKKRHDLAWCYMIIAVVLLIFAVVAVSILATKIC